MSKKFDAARAAVLLAKLINKYDGWVDEQDSDMIRFPTPYQKDQFLKEYMNTSK